MRPWRETEIVLPRVGLVRSGRGWQRQLKLQRRLQKRKPGK